MEYLTITSMFTKYFIFFKHLYGTYNLRNKWHLQKTCDIMILVNLLLSFWISRIGAIIRIFMNSVIVDQVFFIVNISACIEYLLIIDALQQY